jgi:hypothetical protein
MAELPKEKTDGMLGRIIFWDRKQECFGEPNVSEKMELQTLLSGGESKSL